MIVGMLKLSLIDDQYPFTGVTHVRPIARALVLDEQNRVAIHVVERDDIFCAQRYFETPGGGLEEGESFEEAVVRECKEEIGYVVEPLCCLGEVEDYYNLIGRKNINRYFLARRKEQVGIHHASQGDEFIKQTLYLPIDEAIALYESQSKELVAGLVRQRELPILMAAKEEMENRGLL